MTKWTLERQIPLAFSLALALLVVVGVAAYRNIDSLISTAAQVTRTQAVIAKLEEVLSTLKDAETGQRGFLLTGDERYLEPYRAATGRLGAELAELRQMTADDGEQRRRLDLLAPLVAGRLAELRATLEARRDRGLAAAMPLVRTDRGMIVMNRLREMVDEMEAAEHGLLAQREAEAQASTRRTRQVILLGGVLSILLVAAAIFQISRSLARRRRAEAELQLAHDELETRVAERTAELGESEARFRQLADSMPQMVWTARADGYLDYYNRRWYDFTGFPEGAEGDQSWEPILHPDDVWLCYETWYHSVKRGEPYEIEYRFKDRHRGGYRWFLGRALPIHDAEGRVVRWFGTCTDIDDQKRVAEERARLLGREQAARAEAEEANRLKDEFLATVSHELRTPLNAMLGWVHLLRGGRLTPEQTARALETVERNARAQNKLVEDLLDVSRIITGKLRLDLRRVDPAPLVEAAVEAARPAAGAKGIELQTSLEGGAGEVMGDPDRLQQVVWNLVSNAIKFTPRGGRVRIGLGRVGPNLEISVSDTGEGIAPEFLPHVFERFRQADASPTRPHGGLGLGLAIVRHLTELHGGAVRAASDGPGRGASFYVLLPRWPEADRGPGGTQQVVDKRSAPTR